MEHLYLSKTVTQNKAAVNSELDEKNKYNSQLSSLPASGNPIFKNGKADAVTSDLLSNPVQKKDEKKRGNLPDEIQMKMENAFETDFSDVIIHENSTTAKDLDALAYTQGDEIHFESCYNPSSIEDQELLGHELSHVVQQRNGEVETTHFENGLAINADSKLEQRAEQEAKKAANGQKANKNGNSSSYSRGAVQKKSGAIQKAWKSHPGLWRVERTKEPDPDEAWRAVASAIGQVIGGFAGGITEEFRGEFYNKISTELEGGLTTIPVSNFKTFSGPNMTWNGEISFKIAGETPEEGGGQGQSTLTSGGSTTAGTTITDTQGGGTTGGVTATSTPAGSTGGTGGSATAGVSSTSSYSRAGSFGQTGNTTGISVVSSNLPRYHAYMACFVHLSASSSFGDSGWDYVNPFAWVSGAGSEIGTAINGSGDASTNVGEVYYYLPSGIVPPQQNP